MPWIPHLNEQVDPFTEHAEVSVNKGMFTDHSILYSIHRPIVISFTDLLQLRPFIITSLKFDTGYKYKKIPMLLK